VLPHFSGRPIRVEIRASLGRHFAAANIPRRVILLDAEVLLQPGDFDRILVHEIFHFVWRRLSNATRRDWEEVLRAERDRRARGELGWSAEWRKHDLSRTDPQKRSPAWRGYACESFCDTAAWLYAGLQVHEEFTLAPRFRLRRKDWFRRVFPATARIPI
jgi:hypothetical protein